MKLITTLALMVVFGALLLSMESAQGIKCFYCPTPCADETKQTERDCEDFGVNNTLCLITQKQPKDDGTPGAMSKGCKTAQQKEEAEKIGIKCDDFGERKEKWCYCDKELCNEKAADLGITVPTGSPSTTGATMVTGYSSRHLLLGAAFASVAAYFGVNVNLF